MRTLDYWPEFIAFISLTLLGLMSVDAYRDRTVAETHYQVSQDFQYIVSELTVATLLVDYATTENYDKQAQLLLAAEDTWRNIKNQEVLQSEWQTYNNNIAHFVQLASMLKTSRRFVAEAERHFDQNLTTYGAHGEHVVALILSFETSLNQKVANDIREYIAMNEAVLQQITGSGMQWTMLKQHIEFILDNAKMVSNLVRTIRELPLPATLQHYTRVNSVEWNNASQHLYFMAMLLVINLFMILACVFVRQSLALKRSSQKAFAAAEAKSQFLANMSHEIRTPLNGIIGLADLCLRTSLDKVQKGYLEKLLFSGKSLLTIINDILDFSKIESKKLDIVEVDFEVESLFANVKTMIAKQASEKGLELIFVVEPDVPKMLHGDNIRIGQVLLNLVSNAIKFTQQGHVIIRLCREACQSNDGGSDLHSVGHNATENGRYRFTVEDTGIGLTPEQTRKLFSRFTQADSSTTRKFGGTGLGLSISKLLTELMHGEIGVKSEVDKGSQFFFSLPLADVTGDYGETYALFPDSQLQGKSLLILEDHPITMEITARMAEHMGLEVTQTFTVKDAAKASAQQHFDFALVDWHLPNQNGGLLLKKWQHTGVHPTNIIIFTAFDSEVFRSELGSLDEYQVINKPILLHQLYDAFMAENTASDTQAETSNNEQSTQNHRAINVLLVEDNAINQVVAGEMLRDMQVDVDIAENGLQALQYVEQNDYDLVLMDIQMPEMDGMQATMKLRETYTCEQLPIIALTANVLKSETEKYVELGMNDHLGKPFDRDALTKIVNKYAPKSL